MVDSPRTVVIREVKGELNPPICAQYGAQESDHIICASSISVNTYHFSKNSMSLDGKKTAYTFKLIFNARFPRYWSFRCRGFTMHCEMIPIFISQNLLKGTATPFKCVNCPIVLFKFPNIIWHKMSRRISRETTNMRSQQSSCTYHR